MPQKIGSETGSLTAMAAPGRDAIVARYRHLRQINRRHQEAALRFVPATALRKQAQRLGLMARNTFVAESVAEITLAFDLCLFTAPPGRSCAMERYARSIRRSRDRTRT